MTAGAPEQVYELIADVTRMGEWSPESAGAEWLTGEPGAVGSTFRGKNRRPWLRWSTVCAVTVADPGKRFAFVVVVNGQALATWEFEITPRAGGCEIIQRAYDQRPWHYKMRTFVTTGLVTRSVRNRRTMTQTLDALAAAVER